MSDHLVTDAEADRWMGYIPLSQESRIARLIRTRAALIEALEFYAAMDDINNFVAVALLARLHDEGSPE